MEVPEIMLYGTDRLSVGSTDIEATGDHAASMSTPGAVRSGCVHV